MKTPIIDTRYTYQEGKLLIRPMAKCDITACACALSNDPKRRIAIRQNLEKRLNQITEDSSDLLFSVLYDGKFWGSITTTARNSIGTKANVDFLLPTDPECQELNATAVKCFIELCRETRLYDEELHIMSYEDGHKFVYCVNLSKE